MSLELDKTEHMLIPGCNCVADLSDWQLEWVASALATPAIFFAAPLLAAAGHPPAAPLIGLLVDDLAALLMVAFSAAAVLTILPLVLTALQRAAWRSLAADDIAGVPATALAALLAVSCLAELVDALPVPAGTEDA
jgi:hypothetical protein